MAMEKSFVLKFQRETYDIDYSANAAFYAFAGNRYYYKFTQFIDTDDLKLLEKYIQNDDRNLFPIKLLDEAGNNHWCICKIISLENEECTLEIALFQDIKDLVINVEKQLDMANYILEIYGDYYFQYDNSSEKLFIYAAHKGFKKIATMTIKELEENLTKSADQELQVKISTFLLTLKSGVGFSSLIINTDIVAVDGKERPVLIKMASYETTDKTIQASGYIHIIEEDRSGMVLKLPEVDYLTGVLNKAEITKLAVSRINTQKMPNTTIAIIDVDHFKSVNDNYGHQKGDEVLKKVAQIIEREAGPKNLTGRIGGDEFLVIFADVDNMEKNREYLRGMKNAIHMEYPGVDGTPIITLSIGCASYPKDADNYEDLLTLADYSLYLAKKKGKDRYIIYDVQKHDSLSQIQESKKNANVTGREEMTASNAVCTIYDKLLNSSEYEIHDLLEDVVRYMKFDRAVVYAGEDMKLISIAGDNSPSTEVIADNSVYLKNKEYLEKFSDKGMLIINNIGFFQNRIPEVYEKFEKQNSVSVMQFRLKDKNNNPFVLSIEAVSRIVAWNQENMKYYRLLAKAVSFYELL